MIQKPNVTAGTLLARLVGLMRGVSLFEGRGR
jgi:hypothetical protein